MQQSEIDENLAKAYDHTLSKNEKTEVLNKLQNAKSISIKFVESTNNAKLDTAIYHLQNDLGLRRSYCANRIQIGILVVLILTLVASAIGIYFKSFDSNNAQKENTKNIETTSTKSANAKE